MKVPRCIYFPQLYLKHNIKTAKQSSKLNWKQSSKGKIPHSDAFLLLQLPRSKAGSRMVTQHRYPKHGFISEHSLRRPRVPTPTPALSNSVFPSWKPFNTSTVSEHNYLWHYFRIQERLWLNYNNMCSIVRSVPDCWLLQENICFPNARRTLLSALGFTKGPAKRCSPRQSQPRGEHSTGTGQHHT